MFSGVIDRGFSVGLDLLVEGGILSPVEPWTMKWKGKYILGTIIVKFLRV